jgi:hypothetical protein
MTASTPNAPSDKLTIAEVCADLDISRRIGPPPDSGSGGRS